MGSLDEFLDKKLSERREQGLTRKLTTSRLPVDFFSNDYLGLANSEDLSLSIENVHRALGIKNGSTGSRLLSGNSPFTEKLENTLSEILKCQATLVFNSGYSANLAVLSSVPQKGDTILYDSLAHASLKDGARLSLASRHSFRHNDLMDLERKIRSSKGKKFIVVEAIYSMDGDECPLEEIISLAKRHDAAIILDEAHSTGVRGPQGAGYCVEQKLEDKVDIRIYTFGKGMGVHGACVCGSRALINYLINFARPFIYTTALSQHQVVSIHCAFEFLALNAHLQQVLRDKIDLYSKQAARFPSCAASRSAIQTILCPGNDAAKQLATALQGKGLDVRPILSPTVAEGTERLRICLHAFNNDQDIMLLTQALKSLV